MQIHCTTAYLKGSPLLGGLVSNPSLETCFGRGFLAATSPFSNDKLKTSISAFPNRVWQRRRIELSGDSQSSCSRCSQVGPCCGRVSHGKTLRSLLPLSPRRILSTEPGGISGNVVAKLHSSLSPVAATMTRFCECCDGVLMTRSTCKNLWEPSIAVLLPSSVSNTFQCTP